MEVVPDGDLSHVRAELWSPKTCSRKRNTRAVASTTHSGGDFLFACHQLPSSAGRMAEDFGFLDLDCGVNKSAANYWRGLDETAPAGGS